MSECANPQFLEWVKEWWDEAKHRNSKGASTYKKAYDSLKACPIPYDHPAHLIALTGFGPKICDRLTDKLKKLCEQQGRAMPKKTKRKRNNAGGGTGENGDEDDSGPSPVKKSRKKQDYIPKYRSGGYGIVMALSTLDEDEGQGMTKAQLIDIAQEHCDASYTVPSNQGAHYTAWSSMKQLTDKELVWSKGRPTTRYNLSDEGWDMAKKMLAAGGVGEGFNASFKSRKSKDPQADTQDPGSDIEITSGPSNPSNQPDVVAQGKAITSTTALPKFTPILIPPSEYTISLVLDVREIRSKTDRDYMQTNLIKKGITPIMRSLDLGDALWVATLHSPTVLSQSGAEGTEVLLDYVIERKRLDDLISSIKDRRFTEQKFRLEKSGVRNKIYVIEEYSAVDGAYESHIATAIAGMQVREGFFVRKTMRMDDTIDYLVNMTHLLTKRYATRTLNVIPTSVLTTGNYLPLLRHLESTQPEKIFNITYPAFASLSSKTDSLTLRDVYLKMLMCIKGLTGEKAIELQKRWGTPNALVEAYRGIDIGAGAAEAKRKKEAMVYNVMGELVGRKKIGKALSKKIAEVWGEWDVVGEM